MKLKTAFLVLAAIFPMFAGTQPLPRSETVADAAMHRWPLGPAASFRGNGRWMDGFGILLAGLEAEWLGTANPNYFRYLEAAVDGTIASNGKIARDDGKTNHLDNMALARELLLIYRVTRQEKYWKAVESLRGQLAVQPHSSVGRMEPEDLYRAEPFDSEYASVFNQPRDFIGVTRQFVLMDRYAPGARKSAWTMMALVDTLPFYPRDDPGKAALLAMLRRTAKAAARSQDRRSGLWLDESGGSRQSEDFFHAFTAGMFTYALAKAVRLGYLPDGYAETANLAYRGVIARYGGLSAIGDDPGTAGALLLAAREMEVAPLAKTGRGKTVVLDAWFNSQQRKNALGENEYFHYKWDDYSDSGYSLLGHVFNDFGIETETLYEAPTAANLRSAQFYIIVSPDIPVKNPNPHYVTRKDAEQVAAWVKQGGILLIMENDPDNADIDHVNILADQFGLHFNKVLSHHVLDDAISMGRIEAAGGGELFDKPHVFFMKDTCTLSPSGAAKPLLVDRGDVMMATAKYGKGTVFAVVDPWLYNEYTDGRKLPPEYDNFKGAQALIGWLIRQLPAKE